MEDLTFKEVQSAIAAFQSHSKSSSSSFSSSLSSSRGSQQLYTMKKPNCAAISLPEDDTNSVKNASAFGFTQDDDFADDTSSDSSENIISADEYPKSMEPGAGSSLSETSESSSSSSPSSSSSSDDSSDYSENSSDSEFETELNKSAWRALIMPKKRNVFGKRISISPASSPPSNRFRES